LVALSHVLFTLAGLLVLIALLQPLAVQLRVSGTVLLAVVGVCLGVAAGFFLQTDLIHAFEAPAELLIDFPITSAGFLYIFLPLLLFEAALLIDVRRMIDDAAPIFLLAVVAVFVTTIVVGLALWPVAPVPLVACLLVGAIIATTDPAAVVAIFRDLGAPGRLTRLVEGESLLNDAAAIALFALLLEILLTGREPVTGEALARFATSFAGGALLGVAGGRLIMMMMRWLRDERLAETTLTLALPYIVFILGEHLGVSGVTATVAAGLTVSALSRRRLSPETRRFLHAVWQQLAFWASSLVFILAAILVPRLLIGINLFDVLLTAIVALAAFAARALVLFGLLPLLSTARLAQRVDHRYKLVILWGGMRGAVTLALALGVTENRAIDPEIQRFVAILATGFVLLTLLVNGTTLRRVIHLLKLDRLSPLDQALRHQVLALSLSNVRDAVRATASDYRIGPVPTNQVLDPYEERIVEATERGTFDSEIADRERVTLGLVALAVRERELILEHFEQRSVSRHILERLLSNAEELIDGARLGGRTGYNRAARRHLGFGWAFRLAHALHRYLRIERALAARLADRFEQVLVSRMALEELTRFADAKMTPLLGRRVAEILGDILEQRLDATAKALDALRVQYPAYAEALERRFLMQYAIRLEGDEYETLFEEGLIGQELHNDLAREVEARRTASARRPRLDLGLDTRELVWKFPLFSALDPEQLARISDSLQSRIAVPGERLIRRGERGNAMFFIFSGAVEVAVGRRRIVLGRGDFFGELALLGNRPRHADVTALGYCHLLVLAAEDFRTVLATDPKIRKHINRIAADRLESNRAEPEVELAPGASPP
jgi:monovalent cation:H+ antiporter, CPA1 family